MDYVRGVEGTHTDLNGWHLHIHALLIFPTDVSAEIPALTCEVYTRWAAGLAKKGMSATAEHGIDVRVGNGAVEKMGKYISKLAFETAGGRWKRGKRGSRTPFQILADAIDTGNERDVALWQEWNRAATACSSSCGPTASSSAAGSPRSRTRRSPKKTEVESWQESSRPGAGRRSTRSRRT
ncbi:hypothetical protein [Pseudonocardia sp. Ae717_Ps2]|uniref:hypothetical protein n=1 Tax=Pseudonocardia sp. Ae717_Ps2 TaxID=1885573 RepID=UPI000AA0D063|nr:hypothetical protein [Pseudonocardia sp. Ae717_Ps2]